jgi:hypothetical protein
VTTQKSNDRRPTSRRNRDEELDRGKVDFFHPNFTIHPPDARRKRVLTRQMFRHVNSLFASVLNDR